MTYEEFKDETKNRSYGLYNEGFQRVIEFISNTYGEENILAFYAKNASNKFETELYFVFTNGLLIVSKQDDFDFKYEYVTDKIINKQLLVNKFPHLHHELTISFENREKLVFHNSGDSDSVWAEYYTNSIIQLFKHL